MVVSSDIPRCAVFETASRLDHLEQAWHRVRLNAGAAGGDGVSIETFGETAALRLLSLHRALRSATYAPGPLRRVAIPKPDGGERILTIPSVGDRVVQTSVAQALTPHLEPLFADCSFAYRPGRSVQQAVNRVRALKSQGFGWVVDADIERFFDCVPHVAVFAALTPLVNDPPLLDLIALWFEQIATDSGLDAGLPQGSPLSPLLSNLVLDSFDDAAQEAAFGPAVRLVRYADDFVLLCKSQQGAERALLQASETLNALGLNLHPEKTRVVSFDQGFQFLGRVFVKSLVLDAPDDAPTAADEALRLLALRDAETIASTLKAEQEAAGGLCAVTRVLYVMEPKRRLTLRNESLSISQDGHEMLALSPGRVDRVEIGPAATIDDDALRSCLSSGITVHFVDGWGRVVGHCLPPTGQDAGLHLAQARQVLEAPSRTAMAQTLVAARLFNQRALLRRLNRRRKDAQTAQAALELGKLMRSLPLKEDVPSLLGVEGHAAAVFWPAWGHMLRPPWSFERRLRRPPPDPVNLVLGWLSSLLAREVQVLLLRHGLHSGFACLHGTRDDHLGCVYDQMEPLRAPLVEALTISLFNQRHLTQADFDLSDPERCRILPEARRTVIRQWEDWLDKAIKSPWTGKRRLWRGIIEDQCLSYARHLRTGEPFQPYRMDY
jgi:CRISPR-associated protein Cas1